MKSTIELKQLELTASIGSYGPDDIVPEVHLLDLKLKINPKWFLLMKIAWTASLIAIH